MKNVVMPGMGAMFRQEPNCREFLDKTIDLSLLNEKIMAALAPAYGGDGTV